MKHLNKMSMFKGCGAKCTSQYTATIWIEVVQKKCKMLRNYITLQEQRELELFIRIITQAQLKPGISGILHFRYNTFIYSFKTIILIREYKNAFSEPSTGWDNKLGRRVR